MRSSALLRALADLAAPEGCAGCGRRASGLCVACRRDLHELARDPQGEVLLDPAPDGIPRVWACASYDGVTGGLVVAHKDRGRHQLRPVLAGLWRRALAEVVEHDDVVRDALRSGEVVPVVPVPSSAAASRSRGERPWEQVVTLALEGCAGLRVVPALRMRRRVADQSGLKARQRAQNLAGAMGPTRHAAGHVEGSVCVLADDVVTTGSTLVEGRRVLHQLGARHVAAAVLAATPLHSR